MLKKGKKGRRDNLSEFDDKEKKNQNKWTVTNFIRSYLHQFFDDSHGLKASLKPLRRPFDRCQSRLEAINIG